MASQYPPEYLPIIDPGHVPLIRIDGLESYEVNHGLVCSRYYVIEPLVQAEVDFSPWRPRVRKLCLSLICTMETQLSMRRQVARAIEQSATILVGASLLM